MATNQRARRFVWGPSDIVITSLGDAASETIAESLRRFEQTGEQPDEGDDEDEGGKIVVRVVIPDNGSKYPS